MSNDAAQALRDEHDAAQPAIGAFVDEANQDHISGWVLFREGVESIEVLVDGLMVGEAEYGLQRNDVGEQFPDVHQSRDAGYCYQFQPDDLSGSSRPLAEVQVRFRSKLGQQITAEPVQLPTARFTSRYPQGSKRSDRLAGVPPSPFPREVHRALIELRGEAFYGPEIWTEDTMNEAVSDLVFLYQRASKEAGSLFWYFSFLMEMWTRLEFNARNFPRINRIATRDRKDTYGVATAPEELFAISHHLANLKSHGIAGNLCEFGCFKGFSTSGLSHACARLGMTMDVFDSFEGLPPSDSSLYSEGEFKGSFDEVTRNVEEFGHAASVRYHKGFFSDSIPHYHEKEIACIWMDVDLDASARDVMILLPRLALQSCVFSDEIEPHHLSEGKVVREAPHPDRVLPPVVDAFDKAGRSIVGEFILGHTGAFRDEKLGIPVVAAAPLLRLKNALLSR